VVATANMLYPWERDSASTVSKETRQGVKKVEWPGRCVLKIWYYSGLIVANARRSWISITSVFCECRVQKETNTTAIAFPASESLILLEDLRKESKSHVLETLLIMTLGENKTIIAG
jgi:hypothetical protein